MDWADDQGTGDARRDNTVGEARRRLAALAARAESQAITPEGDLAAGDVILVEKTSHGFSEWTAVATATEADSGWVKATHANLSTYIRRGTVVTVINANAVLILIGRGPLPYSGSRSAGERLWLSSSTPGLLVSSADSDPWLDLDHGDAQMGTMIPAPTESGSAGVGVEKEITKTTHGFAVKDYVVNEDGTEAGWELATEDNVEDAIWRGIVLAVADADTATILVEGKGTLSSGTLSTNTMYGLGRNYSYGVTKPSPADYWVPWAVCLDSNTEVFLLPPEQSRPRTPETDSLHTTASSGGGTGTDDTAYFEIDTHGGAEFDIAWDLEGGYESGVNDRRVAGSIRVHVRPYNQYGVQVDAGGIRTIIWPESYLDSVSFTHWRYLTLTYRSEYLTQTVASGGWTTVGQPVYIYNTSYNAAQADIQMRAAVTGSKLEIKVRLNVLNYLVNTVEAWATVILVRRGS